MEPDGDLHGMAAGEPSQEKEVSVGAGVRFSLHDRAEHFYHGETPFILDGFILGLCLRGSEEIRVNGKTYSVVPGTVVLLSPNQLVEHGGASEDLERHTVAMSLELVLEFPSPVDIEILSMARTMPVVRASAEEMDGLTVYYRFLEKQYASETGVYREEIAKALLYALMLKLCEVYRREAGTASHVAKPRNEQLTDDFFVLLSRHYRRERSVKFYASRMNRTPKYLSGAVKRITGRSISDWIDEVVVIEIKRQLKTTDRTVLQISEEAQFFESLGVRAVFQASYGDDAAAIPERGALTDTLLVLAGSFRIPVSCFIAPITALFAQVAEKHYFCGPLRTLRPQGFYR